MAAVQVSAYRETPLSLFFKRENKIRELGKSGSSAGFVRVSGGKKRTLSKWKLTRDTWVDSRLEEFVNAVLVRVRGLFLPKAGLISSQLSCTVGLWAVPIVSMSSP